MFTDFSIFPLLPASEALARATGEHGKGLLLLRRAADRSAETDTLLANILKALQLDEGKDCRTLLLDEQASISLVETVRTSGARYCVSFGPRPRALGAQWEWPAYQVLHRGGVRYLFADTLSRIGEDDQRKRALWNGLKDLMSE